MRLPRLLAASLCVAAMLIFADAARANTFTVTITADLPDAAPGDGVCETGPGNAECTLRAAIQEANALAGDDDIVLPAGTFVLTRIGADDSALNGDLDITGRLTVRGVTSATSIVDANGLVTGERAFDVRPGAVATMSGVTITGGRGDSGGGIRVQGALALSDCRVGKNTTSGSGGGLFVDAPAAVLVITRCEISHNRAGYDGGGIWASGIITITDSLIERNEANTSATIGNGGGVHFVDASSLIRNTVILSNTGRYGGGVSATRDLVIEGSAILSNTASRDGGGIAAEDYRLTDSSVAWNTAAGNGGGVKSLANCSPTCDYAPVIARSLIGHNRAITSGGGIALRGVNMTILDSSIVANDAGSGGGISSEGAAGALVNSTLSGNTARGNGGGIAARNISCQIAGPPCALRLSNVTIASNMADDDLNGSGAGGGVYIAAGTPVSAQNSIIAGNLRGLDCFGPLGSLDYNLIQTTTNCAITGQTANNITGLDPGLKPLSDYGGATATRLPQPDSPVLDRGNPAGCGTAADQRGMPRPKAGRCDIGAVEGSDTVRAFVPATGRTEGAW